MPIGQLRENNQYDGDKVNLRREEKVRDLEDLLAAAEMEACVSGDEFCGKNLKSVGDKKSAEDKK